jgi:glycosyltransferase involved in cell wall biosynthesis
LVQNLAMPAERISVVPLGVDEQQYQPLAVPDAFRIRYELSDEHRYVLYVGSEDPRKNLEMLWRAFAIACRRDPGLRLLKVGPAQSQLERQRLVGLADELGIERAVRFLDYVPEDDLPLLYNVASMCVVPSLYEGFGLPVLEAMACGTPVVCSSAASLPEVAGDAALLVSGTDSLQLADAIGALLEDSEQRTALRDRALRRAMQFRWATTVSRMIGVYEAAIGRHHRPMHPSSSTSDDAS